MLAQHLTPCFSPQPQPPREPVQTQHTKTIRNAVNLKKPSLKLVPVPEARSPRSPTPPPAHPASQEPGKFSIQFTFDAAAPCTASVFILASESAGGALRPRPGQSPVRVPKPAGLAQKVTWEELFDPSSFPLDQLLKPEGETFPLVIRLETLGTDAAASADASRALPEPPGCALPGWVQSQTTYASLSPGEHGWSCRVLKQRIWVDGTSYELQEIYGIENCATGNAEEDAMAGKECVVCLSEARDTTVLPCRHMCMCSGCARALRYQTNRCPICRTPVESLLEIKVERRATS